MFSQVCVKNSVQMGENGGVHGIGGVHGRGHVWQGACVARRACVAVCVQER